jgi:type IV secretion system protein VirB1
VDSTSFLTLAMACAPWVHPHTAQALVRVESAFNPWAIGVVGGRLERQPRSLTEALATARALQAEGWNFSVGLGQINRYNFAKLGLSLADAFDPCSNLQAMQQVLGECLLRAQKPFAQPASDLSGSASARQRTKDDQAQQQGLQRALSCYYSGNFQTGFQHGYVRKVLRAASAWPL